MLDNLDTKTSANNHGKVWNTRRNHITQALERSPAVRVVCFDTVPTTVQLIKEGVIAATIDQQPFVQGSKPLSILYEYLTLGTLPREKLLYTSLNIRIRENL